MELEWIVKGLLATGNGLGIRDDLQPTIRSSRRWLIPIQPISELGLIVSGLDLGSGMEI